MIKTSTSVPTNLNGNQVAADNAAEFNTVKCVQDIENAFARLNLCATAVTRRQASVAVRPFRHLSPSIVPKRNVLAVDVTVS